MAVLRQLDSDGKLVAEFSLEGKDEAWIGRSPENDIVLPSNDVSRRHARIVRTERGYLIVDNDSQNGILVAGELVRTHILQNGDLLQLGTITLEFVDLGGMDKTVVLTRPPRPGRIEPTVFTTPPEEIVPPRAAPAPSQPLPPPVVPVEASPPVIQPAPQQPAPPSKPGCRYKGCLLGCLIFFLAFGAIVFGLYVWWAKPPWMTKFYFWRKSLNPQLELAALQGNDQADLETDARRVEALRQEREAAVRMQGIRLSNYVRKEVSADRGDTLSTPDGASLEIPPGSLSRDAVVEFAPRTTPSTPQRSGQWTLLSDVYVVRVDGQEHTEFWRPMKVGVPAVSEANGQAIPMDQIRPIWWDGKAWREYSGPVVFENGKAWFQIPHATDVGIGATIAGGVGRVGTGIGRFTGTLSELGPWVSSARFLGHEVYRTTNFAIYYVRPGPTGGSDAVRDDASYALAAGRKPAEHPLYVLDAGAALELAKAHAPSVGVNPETLYVERYTALLENVGGFGETPLGGPMYIDSRMDGVHPDVNWGEVFLTTVTHEFVHVLQDEYFQWAEAAWNSALVETTAEALAELIRFRAAPKQHPSQYMATRQYLYQVPDFSRTSMDSEGSGDKTAAYAWAAFFLWAETDGGAPGLTGRVMAKKAAWNQFASASRTIEQVLGEIKPGESFGAFFNRFSIAFLHDDMWDGKLLPKSWWADADNHLKLAKLNLGDAFFRRRHASEEHSVLAHGRQVSDLNHMTARYDFVDGEYVRNEVPGKAYVRIRDVKKPGAQLTVFADHFQNGKPHAKGSVNTIQVSGADQTIEILNFGNHPSPVPTLAPNRLNFLITNDRPAEDNLDFAFDTWLLLPPPFVAFDRQGTMVETAPAPKYLVQWNPSPLSKNKEIFSGYNIYRRKAGDSVWPGTPLNEKPYTEVRYEDTPPDKFDYEYAVTVLDAFKHESEKSPVESEDPWVGEWSGSFRLKEGTLIDESKYTPEQLETWKGLIVLMKKLEVLLKLGVPVRFRIDRSDGKYYLHPISVFGKGVEDAESDGHFMRLTKHNLQWMPDNPTEEEKKQQPLYFSLEYPDEIHNTWSGDGRTVEWRFTRALKLPSG